MPAFWSSTSQPPSRHFSASNAGNDPVCSSGAPTPWLSESPSARYRTDPSAGASDAADDDCATVGDDRAGLSDLPQLTSATTRQASTNMWRAAVVMHRE